MDPKQLARALQQFTAEQSPDSMLVTITPRELAMLKQAGGSGRIDPVTGLPHFDDEGGGSDEGNDGGMSNSGSNASDQSGQGDDGGNGISQENSFDTGAMANAVGYNGSGRGGTDWATTPVSEEEFQQQQEQQNWNNPNGVNSINGHALSEAFASPQNYEAAFGEAPPDSMFDSSFDWGFSSPGRSIGSALAQAFGMGPVGGVLGGLAGGIIGGTTFNPSHASTVQGMVNNALGLDSMGRTDEEASADSHGAADSYTPESVGGGAQAATGGQAGAPVDTYTPRVGQAFNGWRSGLNTGSATPAADAPRYGSGGFYIDLGEGGQPAPSVPVSPLASALAASIGLGNGQGLGVRQRTLQELMEERDKERKNG